MRDMNTTVDLLIGLAKDEGIDLPSGVAQAIAANSSGCSERELEAALIRVLAYADLTESDITIELAAEVLVATIPERLH